MNKIAELTAAALEAYGSFGIALCIMILIFAGIQIYYYTGPLARLSSFRNDSRPVKGDEHPGISVLVPMGDDFLYVEETLPIMLSQKYDAYEVIIIYLGSNEEFAETLEMLAEAHPKLTTTRIRQHPLFPISNKMALNVGIKAAKYDCIVITTPDAHPVSSRWIPIMAKGFSRGDTVLGYCGVEQTGGLTDKLIRISQMARGMRCLSAAICGIPYGGALQNIGFTRRLYFGNRGFGFLNMNIGEEDLFMQRIFTPADVSIVMHPRATVRRKRWGGLSWWYKECKTRSHTYKYYPLRIKNFLEWETGSRALFFISCAAAVLFMPLEIKIAAAVVAAARYATVIFCIRKASERLGESGLTAAYVIYDLLSPAVDAFIAISRTIRPDKEVWR